MRLSPVERSQLASFVAARLKDDEAQLHSQVDLDEGLPDLFAMTSDLLQRIEETGGVSAMGERTEMVLRRVALRHREHPDYDTRWQLSGFLQDEDRMVGGHEMSEFSCPICSGPLALDQSRVGEGHTGGASQERRAGAEDEVTQALRAALRALEDQAAGERWRLAESDPPAGLAAQSELTQRNIRLLQGLLDPPTRGTSSSRD